MANLVTWNMQGASHRVENKWNEGVRNLFRTLGADVVVLQECGSVPDSAVEITDRLGNTPGLFLYRWGTERSHVYIVWYPSDPNGNRCNLGVVAREEPTWGWVLYPATGPVWRPSVGALLGQRAVFGIHAISPGGADAPGLIAAARTVADGRFRWDVAGDYNREPNTMPGHLFPPGTWQVCPPDRPTYSTIEPRVRIDYLIRDGHSPAVEGVVQNLVLSDHYPVFFQA